MTRILVIKLGALGDVVLAFGPFAAIRAHHPDAAITLLTTERFAGLLAAAPWFDAVVTDSRPRPWDLPGLLRLRRALRGFDFVYDLQTSSRSGWYYRLAGRPPWSGIAPGCSHQHGNPGRDALHTVERQRDQLGMAGIDLFPPPATGWLRAHAPDLPTPYCVLVPGAAPHRPGKRWPAARFGALAAGLAGMQAVVVGGAADAPLAAAIRQVCPTAIDLTGRTTLLELAGICAGAAACVGNDTGPTHLAAALGVPTVALFSAESDPALTRPRGTVTVLAVPDLADLPTARVAAALPPVHAVCPAREDAL